MKIKKMDKVKTHTVYKTKDGQRVPGVTTIIGVLGKPALIYWAWDLGTKGIDHRKYRDETATIGTLGHYLVECFFTGIEPDLSDYSENQISCAENVLLSFYNWLGNKSIKNVKNELQLVSENLKYGGTIDIYCDFDGVKTLIDIKTGKAIYDDYFLQLAAYRNLLIENGYPVQKTIILRIGRSEDEAFEVREISSLKLQYCFEIFDKCRQIYKLKKLIK